MNGKNGIKINRRKGVKSHDKMTLLERLLLKNRRQIVFTATHIVITALQKSKLKKEEMASEVHFHAGVTQLAESLPSKH